MVEKEISEAAKVLSRIGASKGGRARAAKLTPEQRSEISRKAADAKWKTPNTTHAGEIQIGDMSFQCSVLSDGTRVITQSAFMESMGMYYSGWIGNSNAKKAKSEASAEIPHFLAFESLKPFIDKHLGNLQSIAIPYRTEKGTLAKGIRAEIIPKICEVWLDADENGALTGARQRQVAQKAKVLMRALAHVAIVALVDEATGYQEVRDRNELHKILEAYISEELLSWSKRFPSNFYKEICRLKGWGYSPMQPARGPRLIGKITNQIVYEKLPPGVLNELRLKNPIVSNNRRKYKHHQFLTEDIGNPHLDKHIASITTLMRASSCWGEFETMLEKAFPTNP
jgi:hypothetical protein